MRRRGSRRKGSGRRSRRAWCRAAAFARRWPPWRRAPPTPPSSIAPTPASRSKPPSCTSSPSIAAPPSSIPPPSCAARRRRRKRSASSTTSAAPRPRGRSSASALRLIDERTSIRERTSAGMNAWHITWFTVLCAAAATVLVLPFGVGLAWVLARKRFPGRTLLETLISLPLVMPPVGTGLILLMLLSRRGAIGGWLERLGIDIVFTWKAVVLAMAVMGLPLLVRTARAGFEQVH